MAHGENVYPLESKDRSPVDVAQGKDRAEIAASDRAVAAILEELLAVNKRVLMALQILINEEIPDED